MLSTRLHRVIANLVSKITVALCFAVPLTLIAQDRATGALPLPEKKFKEIDKAEAIPGAAVGEPKTSMRSRFPPCRDQGTQFSCTGFAVAYAVKSYLEAVQQGWNTFDDEHVFSPAFIYNQFSNDHGTTGIYIQQALAFLQGGGCCAWKDMPYDPNDASSRPTKDLLDQARKFRIAWWDALPVKNIQTMKSYLVVHVPLIIGANVDIEEKGKWQQNTKGVTDEYLHPDHLGYHSMVVTGYDDDKNAFEVMNSWGPDWNDSGYGWVDYKFWPKFVREGYVTDNVRTAPLAPATGLKPDQVKWLPVGPEGAVNGNWGFPWAVDLKKLRFGKGKTLPAEVKQYLPASFSTHVTGDH